jgi:hypothetical protein
MAVTAKWYGIGLANCFGGTAAGGTAVDYLSDSVKLSLHLDYTPNQDTHSLWSDVSASEVAASGGYSAGGTVLQSKTLTYTGATNVIAFDAADVTYAASTITATQAVIYDASIAGSVLLGYIDFGGTVSSTAGNFTVTFDAGGIFTVTPA